METRNAVVAMWDEPWFNRLSPYGKLIFCYMRDKCDDAGFIEYDVAKWTKDLHIPAKDIGLCLADLYIKECKLLVSPKKADKSKRVIWLKKHLIWQDKLPITPVTEEGRWIIARVQEQMKKFADAEKGAPQEFVDVLNAVEYPKGAKPKKEKGTAEPKKKFVVPDFETQWKVEWLKKRPDADPLDIAGAYDYYVSVGWKVGRNLKPAASWLGLINTCITKNDKDEAQAKKQKPGKQSKIDLLKSTH